LLAQVVMKLASDPPALLVLNVQQLPGKFLKLESSQFDYSTRFL